MPARRAFLVAGLATLLLAVAAVEPRLGAFALVADGLLLVAVLVDGRRAATLPLSARRTWPTLLAQGTATEVTVRIESARPAIIVVREALHPGLAETPRRQELAVPAGGAVWTFPVVPRRRGEHAVGPLTARVLGPWSLAWAQRDLATGEPRRVYPQVRWEGRVGRLLRLAQRHELGQSPLPTPGRYSRSP